MDLFHIHQSSQFKLILWVITSITPLRIKLQTRIQITDLDLVFYHYDLLCIFYILSYFVFFFRIKAALSRSNVNLASGSHQASPRSSRTNSVSVRHRPAPNSPQLPAPPSILIDEIDSTPTGTPEPSPRPTRSRSSSPNDRRHQDLRRQVLISQTALCRQNSSKSLNAATTLSTNQVDMSKVRLENFPLSLHLHEINVPTFQSVDREPLLECVSF